jgi:hypothetical protein
MTNTQFTANESKFNRVLASYGFTIALKDIKKEIVKGNLQGLELKLMDACNEANLDVAAACDKLLSIA